MKRFTYSVAMRDKQCECLDVQSVVSFIPHSHHHGPHRGP
jgi:hypothetical protein